jgi:protein-S-isoprenylcysteine O-methyltransferase Ste14
MSFIPALEIGVWNIWIFMLVYFIFNAAPLNWVILRRDFKALSKKTSTIPSYGKREKITNFLSIFSPLLMVAYSIFLPIPSGTGWFYSGLAIFITGLVLAEVASIPWGTTPVDKPIISGLYRYSRNPMYIGIFIQYLGAGIVSTSLLFLLLALILMGVTILSVISEERLCLEKYGDSYRRHMDRTPRWIGIPKP